MQRWGGYHDQANLRLNLCPCHRVADGPCRRARINGRLRLAQMPKEFQGTWCTNSDTLKKDWGAYNAEDADCQDNYSSVEITATEVKSPALSISCVVRQVTKFDVCPWGMIFRNRERARVARPFQINPWSPGYHIVLQCTGSPKRAETIEIDWVIEKGYIRGNLPRDYRCPWDRKAAR